MTTNEQSLISIRTEKHNKLNGCSYPITNTKCFQINYILKTMEQNSKSEQIIESLDINVLSNVYSKINLHGRIVTFRKSGSITFIKIKDETGVIQVIGTKNSTTNYENINLLDYGDIIEVSGYFCRTKAGENSILISEFKLLTKAIRPPPDKYYGLEDQDTKYRNRHIDLMSSDESKNVFILRSYIVSAIRRFMEDNDFMEVQTPTISTIASGANARPFTTHHNALNQDMFLRIAPELNLKRLMGTYNKVFEIGYCFRNEGIDRTHNPEFTTIEFYSAYETFPKLIDYSKELLQYINKYITRKTQNTDLYNFYKECLDQSDYIIFDNYVTITMKDCVINAMNKASMFCNDDFTNIIYVESEEQTENERQSKIDHKNLDEDMSKADTIGKRIATLFEYVAEPFLKQDYVININDKIKSVPVIITDHPIEISPLARPKDDDNNFCDRGEMYINGKEVANFFQEINDPRLQESRFNDQTNNSKDPMQIDNNYIEMLECGIPPTIGAGFGIDRLVMMFTNRSSIRDVILFPTLKVNENP